MPSGFEAEGGDGGRGPRRSPAAEPEGGSFRVSPVLLEGQVHDVDARTPGRARSPPRPRRFSGPGRACSCTLAAARSDSSRAAAVVAAVVPPPTPSPSRRASSERTAVNARSSPIARPSRPRFRTGRCRRHLARVSRGSPATRVRSRNEARRREPLALELAPALLRDQHVRQHAECEDRRHAPRRCVPVSRRRPRAEAADQPVQAARRLRPLAGVASGTSRGMEGSARACSTPQSRARSRNAADEALSLSR